MLKTNSFNINVVNSAIKLFVIQRLFVSIHIVAIKVTNVRGEPTLVIAYLLLKWCNFKILPLGILLTGIGNQYHWCSLLVFFCLGAELMGLKMLGLND